MVILFSVATVVVFREYPVSVFDFRSTSFKSNLFQCERPFIRVYRLSSKHNSTEDDYSTAQESEQLL